MANVVSVTFGGKPCYEGNNYFALELGIAPSRGVVTMLEEDAKALGSAGQTLKIEDSDGQAVSIVDLYVVQTEAVATPIAKTSGQGSIVEVHIEDKRSLWAWPSISGFYNMFREDRKTYLTNTLKSSTTPWTWDELVGKCFTALGANVTPATGLTWSPRNVKWEMANASAALEALLRDVGWDVALKPDGTFELIDLDSPPQAFKPGKPIVSHVVRRRDAVHEMPATARVAFRILREKLLTFEAVLQDDGLTSAADGSFAANEGQWVKAETLLPIWGRTLAQWRKDYYKAAAPGNLDRLATLHGGGETGHGRVRRIQDQLFKCWRVSDTDRNTILPLVPLRAKASSQTGREVLLPVVAGTTIRYHLDRWNTGTWQHAAGTRDASYFIEKTGRPPWPIRIVDAAEGVVEFVSPHPVTGLVLDGNGGGLPQDHSLEDGAVKITCGYFKKFASTTDPEQDYYLYSKALGTNSNGKTKTFFSEDLVLREVSDGAGGFTKQNQTEIDDAADKFLTAYKRAFDEPNPEEYTCEGIDGQTTLSRDVRAILWACHGRSTGVRTTYRLYDHAAINPFSTQPWIHAREFALEAERVQLLDPSHVDRAGGGGFGGAFDGHPLALSDVEVGQRNPVHERPQWSGWINEECLGLLVAEDWLDVEQQGENTKKTQTTTANWDTPPVTTVTPRATSTGYQA